MMGGGMFHGVSRGHPDEEVFGSAYDHRVVGRQGREFIWRRNEGKACYMNDLLGESFRKAHFRIQPGAHRRASLGKLTQPGQRAVEPVDAGAHLVRVA